MENNTRGAKGPKVAITVVTAAVAFLCGWSAGGWAQGLGLATALGVGGGIAAFSAFSEKPGSRFSCSGWRLRHRHNSNG